MKTFLTEETAKLPYGCLMATFNLPKWKWFVAEFVNEDDLQPQKWMENESKYDHMHVTVLFGFEKEVEIEEVKALLMPLEDIEIEFEAIDHFSNETFDVVKFKCESKALQKLHTVLKTLPHWESPHGFNIHATIAYVKPGKGAKYDRTIKPFKLKPDGYKFSRPDGSEESFTL